ncbi:hypothetical protein WA026_018821 [Henosepilachna vigintioctopunctata]|uniref:Uncharacterized protein n=1 Tax=Henosepilachna vigintioctopunctata TaxID=420089 RepID=A0AAW1TX80_9CUCU
MSGAKLRLIKCDVKAWPDETKNRKHQVLINQLRLGHTNLTHSYLLNHTEEPMIRWLGQVFRREDLDSAKKLTFSKIESTRRRGRLATRWMDSVERDPKVMGITRWRNLAASRPVWRKQTEKALACARL